MAQKAIILHTFGAQVDPKSRSLNHIRYAASYGDVLVEAPCGKGLIHRKMDITQQAQNIGFGVRV